MSDPLTAAGVVTIAAEPASFNAHPATTAVVVVDMQNDFASVGGMFDRHADLRRGDHQHLRRFDRSRRDVP